MKTNQFICLWSMSFLTINMSTFMIGNFQQFASDYIQDQDYFVLVGSIGGFCASLRFFWSLPVDYFSFKIVYSVMILIQFSLSIAIPFAQRNKTAYAICVCIAFFCEGGHFTLVPTMYKKLFGEEGARVFGVGFSFIGFASIFQIILFKTLNDYVSQEVFLYIFGGMCIVALIILHAIFRQEPVVLGKNGAPSVLDTL